MTAESMLSKCLVLSITVALLLFLKSMGEPNSKQKVAAAFKSCKIDENFVFVFILNLNTPLMPIYAKIELPEKSRLDKMCDEEKLRYDNVAVELIKAKNIKVV